MAAANPPSDPVAQLQWLVDREAIGDLISNFGVCVDDKDKAGYASNFTSDAVLELPFGRIEGRDAIAVMKGPPPHWNTQHLFGNIVIDLDGDSATTRAYMMATHVFDPELRSSKAHAGGWYEHTVVRTPEGWRFTRVRLVPIWEDERPMIPGMPPPQQATPAEPSAGATCPP